MNHDIDYQKIFETVIAINSETNAHKLFDIILAKMRGITNCEGGTLYIMREEKLHFTIVHNERLNLFTYEEDTNMPPVDMRGNVENVCAYCARHNVIVNIDDVYENTAFNFQGPRKYDALTGFRTQSMLVFPLADLNGHVIGVIQLLNAAENGKIVPFNKEWEPTIQALSRIAAIALMNVRYVAEIKDLFYSFVKMMTAAIDERTPYNANHTVKVAEYTRGFIHFLRTRFGSGSAYYFDENREEQLIMSAYLHDIGKVITPLEIMDKADRLGGRTALIEQRLESKRLYEKTRYLSGGITKVEYKQNIAFLDDTRAFVERANTAGFLSDADLERVNSLKDITYEDASGNPRAVFNSGDIECLSVRKGTLTETERTIMQEHALVTGRLLSNIKFNKQYGNVPGWAKSHHEFIDGSGYPEKIARDEIPVEVRILTIMDTYDALTASDRPYKKVIPHESAVKILIAMADDGKLDKEIVGLFIESGVKTENTVFNNFTI